MLIYICVYMGILRFILNRKHFLLILLSLEFIIVSLYLNLYIYLNIFRYEYYFLIIFLVIRVCEGVLGLSLLILIVRVHGNDYILTFSSLW